MVGNFHFQDVAVAVRLGWRQARNWKVVAGRESVTQNRKQAPAFFEPTHHKLTADRTKFDSRQLSRLEQASLQ